jgi:hypothetical protein
MYGPKFQTWDLRYASSESPPQYCDRTSTNPSLPFLSDPRSYSASHFHILHVVKEIMNDICLVVHSHGLDDYRFWRTYFFYHYGLKLYVRLAAVVFYIFYPSVQKSKYLILLSNIIDTDIRTQPFSKIGHYL